MARTPGTPTPRRLMNGSSNRPQAVPAEPPQRDFRATARTIVHVDWENGGVVVSAGSWGNDSERLMGRPCGDRKGREVRNEGWREGGMECEGQMLMEA